MKATIIISVIISSLLALVTTIEAQGSNKEPAVLDNGTGNPIRKLDGCVMRAFWNGSEFDFYVDKMDYPYVRLRSGSPPPPRFVRLSQHEHAFDRSDTVRVSTQYYVRFNDSINYWNNGADLFRITETAPVVRAAAQFTFEEAEENRVYKMLYSPSRSKHYEVGMQVKNQKKEDRYYVAIFRTHNQIGTPISKAEAASLKHIRFTFEKP